MKRATVVKHGDVEGDLAIDDWAVVEALDGTVHAVREARAFIKRCHDFVDGCDATLDDLLPPVDMSHFDR